MTLVQLWLGQVKEAENRCYHTGEEHCWPLGSSLSVGFET